MPLPQGRSYGVFSGNISLLPNDYLLESFQDSITATASGTQATAFQLTTQTSRIATVATAADSVALPPAVAGLEILVINHGANPMQVYGVLSNPYNGNVGDTIDDVATATGVSQMSGSLVIYTCATAGAWYSEGLATGYVKGLGLQTIQYANIAANATGTQASGTPLTGMLNIVSSAGSAYSVTLPASAPGMSIQVVCSTATNTVTVFPNAGGTTTEKINAITANSGYAMAALTSTTFVCGVAGQWFTNPRTAS